mgnify:CR=1 FL=1
MTKKILFGMFAAVGLLATSCSDDELNNSLASGDYVNASFSIETPEGILTRAIGDGTQADKVACAIFYNGEELSELRKTVDVTSKTATYNVRLAKGQKYQAEPFHHISYYTQISAFASPLKAEHHRNLWLQRNHQEYHNCVCAYPS